MTLAERVVVATGPRVRIRSFTRDDVDRWQAWDDYDDPLLVATSPRRMAPPQRDQWFEDLVNRQKQLPFAVDDENDQFIGRLFLRNVRSDQGTAVLGIDLAPEKLGMRYGTEALRVFLDHFFGPMQFSEMLLSVAAFNLRARRSYESLGFRVIGSHWDAHPGPNVVEDPKFRDLRNVLRRGAAGVEALYYDMSLTRAAHGPRRR